MGGDPEALSLCTRPGRVFEVTFINQLGCIQDASGVSLLHQLVEHVLSQQIVQFFNSHPDFMELRNDEILSRIVKEMIIIEHRCEEKDILKISDDVDQSLTSMIEYSRLKLF